VIRPLGAGFTLVDIILKKKVNFGQVSLADPWGLVLETRR
jgi:hypothetical protein